jgi:hypothetical protein
MSSFLNDTISKLGRRAAQHVGSSAGASVDAISRGAASSASGLNHAYAAAAQSKKGRQFMGVMRSTAAAGPVGELAKICGRAGVAGAVIDGAIGGAHAFKYVRNGQIDGSQAAKHVAAETGCGFVTSASGTAGTIAVYMITGSMGPTAMVIGMGASMGSRYAYRKVVGDTLPNPAEAKKNEQKNEDDPGEKKSPGDSDVIEEIGPHSAE